MTGHASDPAPGSHITLHELRLELQRLVSLANTAERPKPTSINPAGHPMPGHEWTVEQRTVASYKGPRTWTVRTVDETESCDVVYVSSPDAMYPGEDFVPLLPTDARAVGMALIAAADRAEHAALAVPRLEDRRRA
ncbi:hypothetical protein [Streptomyces erythrochromogenes]|uniref:hypothetical protein n=1 Tax=Streptomyces erythrochromogenes TaxID=285574 RepID=UPI0037D26D0B